jgi:hypothetical protein
VANDDVGAALAGPFDKYLSEWDKMRRREDIDNREGEAWPTVNLNDQRQYLPQMSTFGDMSDKIHTMAQNIRASEEPVTRLGRDAGIHDINLPSKEELMQFLMTNEATGPDAPERVPLPRSRPRR